MEAQTCPVHRELHPPAGLGVGTPVFYGGGVWSVHSQSFRSVSETEEKKKQTIQKPTKQQTNMLHMRTWPSTALAWFASAWPWIFPSLSPSLLRLPCSQQPPQCSPTTEPWAWHGAGMALPHPTGMGGSCQQQESKSPWCTGHVASRQQPRHFPELWGCSCSLHWQH